MSGHSTYHTCRACNIMFSSYEKLRGHKCIAHRSLGAPLSKFNTLADSWMTKEGVIVRPPSDIERQDFIEAYRRGALDHVKRSIIDEALQYIGAYPEAWVKVTVWTRTSITESACYRCAAPNASFAIPTFSQQTVPAGKYRRLFCDTCANNAQRLAQLP